MISKFNYEIEGDTNNLLIKVNSKDCKNKQFIGKKLVEILQIIGLSRKSINKFDKHKYITINNKNISLKSKIKDNEIINIYLGSNEETDENLIHSNNNLENYNSKLEIVYEDMDILAVNKPKNMVVHPTKTIKNGTLANAIINYQKDNNNDNNDNNDNKQDFKIRFINRIDRDTTGIVLIAKNSFAHQKIANQFQKSMKKEYLAIICGKMDLNNLNIHNVDINVDNDIIVNKTNNKDNNKNKNTEFSVIITDKNTDEIVEHTNFEIIQYNDNNNVTLLKASLITGKTHQIRRHLAYLGFPILGDELYTKTNNNNNSNENKDFIDSSLMLHSYKTTFIHPRTNKLINLTQEPPKEFKQLMGDNYGL
ncbi:23S rRNA pseudouridine1911/1915/1917 synthase [Methanococcus voltae PS]|uniref:23S rRNA pseudouridine1911/1915/1917 synthase n=1 Tax=Methanococcus voltae PS TaxID=523842 RepID=A0ABT2EVD2_METVO|nr:RluA family pseudouridine synthase [Methanococcus voltae]MCS3921914.1 23S rRNA pseudouridine1911/1915/1917 synthase [Methanococcus voltae PS]